VSTVIAIGGPPHSGKSVFVKTLFTQMSGGYPDAVYLTRACPDGEGNWFYEAEPELAARLRIKGSYTEEWIANSLDRIRALRRTKPLVFVDLGGKLAPDIYETLKLCDYIVILSASPEKSREWRRAAEDSKCPVLALFHSQLITTHDDALDTDARSEIDLNMDPIIGTMVNLDRDTTDVCYIEAVSALANHIAVQHLP